MYRIFTSVDGLVMFVYWVLMGLGLRGRIQHDVKIWLKQLADRFGVTQKSKLGCYFNIKHS